MVQEIKKTFAIGLDCDIVHPFFESLHSAEAAKVQAMFRQDAELAYDHYREFLNEDEEGQTLSQERRGIARELARIGLPLSFYTQWYWKIDLHNLLGFLALRAHPHAQWEIRVYAEEILAIVAKWVPNTYEAFIDYRTSGFTLSRGGLEAVRRMLKGQTVDAKECGLSAREWRELLEALNLAGPHDR